MTTATLTLTDFLLARIAEDESVARDAPAIGGEKNWWVDGPGRESGKWWVYATGEKFERRETAEHIARHGPARVLAECEAKRRIVEYLTTAIAEDDSRDVIAAYRDAVEVLTLPYADHPDYREEWRP